MGPWHGPDQRHTYPGRRVAKPTADGTTDPFYAGGRVGQSQECWPLLALDSPIIIAGLGERNLGFPHIRRNQAKAAR